MSTNAERHGDPYSRTGDRSGAAIERPAVRPSGLDDGQDGSAAARLLEMTARETDRWRSEARTESDATVADARKEAAELVRAAHAEADRVRQETTALRERHEEDIARLEQVATDTREQLRQHLTEMLARVDATLG